MTRRDVSLFLLFFALSAGLFFFPFIGGKTHFAGDTLYSFHPWLAYAAQSLQSGHFPLWNPYSACGEPIPGNPSFMLFFPGAQLFWLFHFASAWRLFLVLNQFFLFGSFYLFARSWGGLSRKGALLSSLAFSWGGFVSALWEFPSSGATLPFFILVLLFGWTRRWAALALAVALLFFAGYTPFAVYSLLLGGLGLAAQSAREPGGRKLPFVWGAAVGAGVILALAQIVPSWEVTRHSLRALLSEQEAREFLIRPIFLVKFLVPEIFDKVALAFSTPAFGAEFWPVQRNWLNTFFMGTGAFLLALLGLAQWRDGAARFWGAVFICSFAVATGTEPFFSVFRWLPGVRYMSHFSNTVLPALVGLALLAGRGLESIGARRRPFWILWAGAAAFCAGLLVFPASRLALLQALLSLKTLSPAQDLHVAGAALQSLVALAALAGILFLPGRIRATTLLLLTLAELFWFARGLHPLANADFFHKPVPLAQLLQETPARYAIAPKTLLGPKGMTGRTLEEGYQGLRQSLYLNLNIPFRIHSTWNYDVFPLKNFADFRRTIPIDSPLGAPFNFLGAANILSAQVLPPPAKLILRNQQSLIYENPAARQRVGWVPRAVVLPAREQRLRYFSSGWAPAEEVVLEEGENGGDGVAHNINWNEFPGRMEASGNAGPGWLVYSQVHYPGWEAYVNGRRVDLLRANHAFQAVATPAGSWRAAFIYRPRAFASGLLISMAGFLMLGGFVLKRAGKS